MGRIAYTSIVRVIQASASGAISDRCPRCVHSRIPNTGLDLSIGARIAPDLGPLNKLERFATEDTRSNSRLLLPCCDKLGLLTAHH